MKTLPDMGYIGGGMHCEGTESRDLAVGLLPSSFLCSTLVLAKRFQTISIAK